MQATTNGTLAHTEVCFQNGAACCVVMASQGYPTAYQKGFPISVPDAVRKDVYVAGAALQDGVLVTNGGRVLGVTAVAQDLRHAIDDAYRKVSQISFENAYYRKDIGQKALQKTEV